MVRDASKFQFLLGRLKTKMKEGEKFFCTHVSIPLRQAKNQKRKDGKTWLKIVSIPLRQAKNINNFT